MLLKFICIKIYFFKNNENKQQCHCLTISSRRTSQGAELGGLGCSAQEKRLKCPQLLENDKEKGGKDQSSFKYWNLIDALACWLLSLLLPSANRSTILPIRLNNLSLLNVDVHTTVYATCVQTHVNRWSFFKCHNPSCRWINKNATLITLYFLSYSQNMTHNNTVSYSQRNWNYNTVIEACIA